MTDCRLIGFISRGDDSLKDHKLQETYFEHIQEAITNLNGEDYDPILLKLRKLREALVSTNRMDELTVNAFEASVDIAIKAGNYGEMSKSLLRLIKHIYSSVPSERRCEMAAYNLMFWINDQQFMKMYSALPDSVQSSNAGNLALRICKAVSMDIDYVELQKCWIECTASQKRVLAVNTSNSSLI
jgi:SAC3/GANP family